MYGWTCGPGAVGCVAVGVTGGVEVMWSEACSGYS